MVLHLGSELGSGHEEHGTSHWTKQFSGASMTMALLYHPLLIGGKSLGAQGDQVCQLWPRQRQKEEREKEGSQGSYT